MKKSLLFIFIVISALVVNAQGPFGNNGCGGSGSSGNGSGNGIPGDSTCVPGDSIQNHWGGFGGMGTYGDSTCTAGDSLQNHFGHGGNGNFGGGNGIPGDSTCIPGDSIQNQWGHGNHGGFGVGNCGGNGTPGDSTCVPGDSIPNNWGHGGNGTCSGDSLNCPWATNTKDLSIYSGAAIIEEINVYPNPVVDQINIVYSSTSSDFADLRIFSINGKVVYSANINITTGRNNVSYDISDLPKGMYVLQLSSATSSKEMKFIK